MRFRNDTRSYCQEKCKRKHVKNTEMIHFRLNEIFKSVKLNKIKKCSKHYRKNLVLLKIFFSNNFHILSALFCVSCYLNHSMCFKYAIIKSLFICKHQIKNDDVLSPLDRVFASRRNVIHFDM